MGCDWLAHLDQFNFVAFRRVDESDTAAIWFHVRTIGVFYSQGGEVLPKFLQTLDLKRKVRQVGLNLYRPTCGKSA